MPLQIITKQQIDNRGYWVDKILQLKNNFGLDSKKIETDINQEIKTKGISFLLGHLRLCGAVPEKYHQDTTEEKLYSKYTDIIIHQAYSTLGFDSLIIKERADAADVECVSSDYSFVADAKAFRISRTAKNQKDFKVQAMDSWKHGKSYAMLVCPIYQLPTRNSQIYQQAGARSVCIITYTHLATWIAYAREKSSKKARQLIYEIFKTVSAMNPVKNAIIYWQLVNQKMLNFDSSIEKFWKIEKLASIDAIAISKKEALIFLIKERKRILNLSKKDAIQEILQSSKIERKIASINNISNKGFEDIMENYE